MPHPRRLPEGAGHREDAASFPETVQSAGKAMADLNRRVIERASEAKIDPKVLTDFFEAGPSSQEGRAARTLVLSLAGSISGDAAVRRALVLEASRLSFQRTFSDGLRVWGSDRPEEHAALGLDQASFDRLSKTQSDRSLAEDAAGWLFQIATWAHRIRRRIEWIRTILDQEGKISIIDLLDVTGIPDVVRRQIGLVISRRMHAFNSGYWQFIRNAERALQAYPAFWGFDAIQGRIALEWSDALVSEIDQWVQRVPEARPYASEIILELAQMQAKYRIRWKEAEEAEVALEHAVDSALSVIAPLAGLRSVLESLDVTT